MIHPFLPLLVLIQHHFQTRRALRFSPRLMFGKPQGPALGNTEVHPTILAWTRARPTSHTKASSMILASARNPPPAYTEASSTIRTCISAAASTEASPMIWIWARGQANGLTKPPPMIPASVRLRRTLRLRPRSEPYPLSLPAAAPRLNPRSSPGHVARLPGAHEAPTTQVSPTIPLHSRQHHACSNQPDKFPRVGTHRKILRFSPRSPLLWRSTPGPLNRDNPS